MKIIIMICANLEFEQIAEKCRNLVGKLVPLNFKLIGQVLDFY